MPDREPRVAGIAIDRIVVVARVPTQPDEGLHRRHVAHLDFGIKMVTLLAFLDLDRQALCRVLVGEGQLPRQFPHVGRLPRLQFRQRAKNILVRKILIARDRQLRNIETQHAQPEFARRGPLRRDDDAVKRIALLAHRVLECARGRLDGVQALVRAQVPGEDGIRFLLRQRVGVSLDHEALDLEQHTARCLRGLAEYGRGGKCQHCPRDDCAGVAHYPISARCH